MKKREEWKHPVLTLMKISFYQLLIVLTCTGACLGNSAGAQELLNRRVTLRVYGEPLREVLNKLRGEADVRFTYDSSILPPAYKVTLTIVDRPLAEALESLFSPLAISYKLNGKQVILKKEPAGLKAGTGTDGEEDTGREAEHPVSGKITDGKGSALPGVNISVKGTARGTISDENGTYTLTVPGEEAVLVFSFIGFVTREVPVGKNSVVDVTLAEDIKGLQEVVVTALGIKRAEKSVTYATQQVSGAELTTVKNTNLANSLTGKVAGLTVSSSGSGVGGSAKVVLRGPKSLLGNNQALYVVDGIPINNTPTNQPSTAYGGATSYDGGDPVANLNPEDIESISVLKGASAAALYGSQGANGVILITTKSGKEGRAQVGFSSMATFDHTAYRPRFQNSYGPVSEASTQSWGESVAESRDNLRSFFRTGHNLTNAVSLSAGSAIAQTYFSYANTSAGGIEPGNQLARSNFNFREIGHFFKNRLTVDVNTNYVTQTIRNSPLAGLYFNPLTGLYLFPRGVDISPYKTGYEKLNTRTLLMDQQWITMKEDLQQNPWWIVNRNPNELNRNRVLLNASLKYNVTPWFSVQARGSIDRIHDTYEQKVYAGTIAVLAKPNGGYFLSNSVNIQKYGDVLGTFDLNAGEKFRITGVVGGSIRDVKTTGASYTSSGSLGLYYPNIFTLQNTVTDPGSSGDLPANHAQYQSVFASANIAYNEAVYLDITARNDWASPLTFTKKGVSFFYPSAGLNVILSQFLGLPEAVSFAKIRGSYAEVGNAPLAYQSNPPVATIGSGGNIVLNSTSPYSSLAPEKTKSLELGMEWKFFSNRLSADVTYYKTNTYNQTLLIGLGQASFYNDGYLNAGNIRNQGVEVMLRYEAQKRDRFTWNTGLNFALNRNRVIELAPGVSRSVLSGASGANYQSEVRVGGSIGDIYGRELKRDAQGRVLIDATGAPVPETGDFSFLGNSNPRWQMGWNNHLSYGGFNFSLLIDGKFGGKVMSVTQQLMDGYGVSEVTGEARKAGGVAVNGVTREGQPVTSVDALKWYSTVGGRTGVSGEYLYDATVVRLREMALGYAIPVKNSVISALKLSLTGRNLFYFSKKAPFDPELTMSTGNGLPGIDLFMPPATRSFGINVNATF